VVAGLAWPDRDPVTLPPYSQRNSPLDRLLPERFDVIDRSISQLSDGTSPRLDRGLGLRRARAAILLILFPADATAWILNGS
jgi:hypothetical protein